MQPSNIRWNGANVDLNETYMPRTINGNARKESAVEVNNMIPAAINGELAISSVAIKRGAYINPLMIFDLTDWSLPWYPWDMKKIKEDIYIAKPIRYTIKPITVVYPTLLSVGWAIKYEGKASSVNGTESNATYLKLLQKNCHANVNISFIFVSRG